jgi:hypothetical protein
MIGFCFGAIGIPLLDDPLADGIPPDYTCVLKLFFYFAENILLAERGVTTLVSVYFEVS